MAQTPNTPIDQLNSINAESAKHIGDLYEITDKQSADIERIDSIVDRLRRGDEPFTPLTGELTGSFFEESVTPKRPIYPIEQYNNVTHFYRLLRDFVGRVRSWDMAIRYQTKPDEVYDLTLVSYRVYGRHDEFMTIAACADLDSVENPLPQKLIVLPTESQLMQLKRQAGFANLDMQRPL